jgi:hypothetical protein
MIALKVTVKDTFGKWLGGVGRLLGVKGEEAGREISSQERPEPRDEAEEALWQAMGWNEPEGEDAGKVTARAVGEVLDRG